MITRVVGRDDDTDDDSGTSLVVVAPRTQVHHEGRTYAQGEQLEVPGVLARQWQRAGHVTAAEGGEAPSEPAQAKKPAARKRRP